MGGDDITEFLYVMLDRIRFPYRDINLARSYDWNVMEDLKARICTLAEVCTNFPNSCRESEIHYRVTWLSTCMIL
jgi:hypothetical protein